jgi:hypothetical protein
MNDNPLHATPERGAETNSSNGLEQLYVAATSQWIHADQMRWTILYNFLVGNTILLVAWSTLFAALLSHQSSIGLRIVLIGSCSVGLGGGVLWAFLESRANRFSKLYFDVALAIERRVSARLDGTPGSFVVADEQRRGGSPVKSHRVLIAVPLVFAAMYAGLLLVSIYAAAGRF